MKIQRSDVFLEEVKLGNNAMRVAKAHSIEEHPPLFTLDNSALGGGAVLAGPDKSDMIRGILFPTTAQLTDRQRRDVAHLSQHLRVGCDVFVTSDEADFVKQGKKAKLAELGVWVFTPPEIVGLLRRLYDWT